MFPVIRARGRRALVLVAVVGVSAGLGCGLAMFLGVPALAAGAIGGGLSYGAAYATDRQWRKSRKSRKPK